MTAFVFGWFLLSVTFSVLFKHEGSIYSITVIAEQTRNGTLRPPASREAVEQMEELYLSKEKLEGRKLPVSFFTTCAEITALGEDYCE